MSNENKKNEDQKNEKAKPYRPDPHEPVEVISNVQGKLVYHTSPDGLSGQKYTWKKNNDMNIMTVQQLTQMASTFPRYFEEQWVKIEDEKIRQYLHVDHYYIDELKDDVIEKYLKGTESGLKSLIDRATMGEKTRIIAIARDLVEKGKLTDYRIIEFIEKKFGADLKPVEKK